MPTVFDEIIRYKARKLAQVHIKRAVQQLTYGGQFNFEDYQREINNSRLSTPKSIISTEIAT